ncbi:MAG: RNA polymerase sigma-70 factor, partial [Chitinophagaceae bacterium]
MAKSTGELYKEYFEAYFEGLFTYAFTIVKDQAEAKDIAQSSFIKLWEKREEIDFSRSARAYLFTTVYHLSLNTARNKKIRSSHHENLKSDQSFAPLYTSEQKEMMERIQQAIDQLPPRCKEVFVKSRLEAKKYAEIAQELSISIKTVEAQMGKALKFLKTELSDLAMFI